MLLALALLAAPSLAQHPVTPANAPTRELRLVEERVPTIAPSPGSRPLLDARGAACGTIDALDRGVRLTIGTRVVDLVDEPFDRFRFTATPDGRTILAQGDPRGGEHAFELVARVYRDGVLAFALEEPVRTDSVLTLDDDGRAVLLHAASAGRSPWTLTLVDPPTGSWRRVVLPDGTRASDPVTIDGTLHVRLYEERAQLETAALHRLGPKDLDLVLPLPGVVELVRPPGLRGLLARSNERLALLDPARGAVAWSVELADAPRSPGSWAASPDGAALAVLTVALQRRGDPPPLPHLHVLDVATGARVADAPVADVPRDCLPRLSWSGDLRLHLPATELRFALR